MGVVFLDATVTGPKGKQQTLKFLVDSGVMYTLLPLKAWRAIGLKPERSIKCHLDDGTGVERKVSECQIALAQGKRHTPVMLGEQGDEAVLGSLTLAEFGLLLNPFTRRIQQARLRLGVTSGRR
jgi:predicted aspartyl protease